MFTGIVQDIGRLQQILPQGSGATLLISTALPLDEVKLGDSIAVCGACLTVVRKESGLFGAEISRETSARSTLASLRPGAKLHLERAMRLSDRLDGHLVLGHVDGIGRIAARVNQGDSLRIEITAPAEVMPYLVAKGSIAVHGVSLTINGLLPDGFSVQIVGFTQTATFLAELSVGEGVNLEADLIGKYVERLLTFREEGGRSTGGLTLAQLARNGFVSPGQH